MIRRHLLGVLSYFMHRITNSSSEALNSTIQMIKKRPYSFRSLTTSASLSYSAVATFGYTHNPSHPNPGRAD